RTQDAAATLRTLWLAQLLQERLHLPVAIGDLLLVGFPQLQRLAQGEELFLFPAAPQTFLPRRRFLFLDLLVAQRQQFAGSALAFEDRTHDFESAHAAQIA